MIGYYLAIGLGWLVSLLPFRLLYVFSDFICFILRDVMAYRKDVIMDNLRRSFPEKEEAELENIRNRFYRNFSDLIVESFKSLTISEKTMRRHFRLTNPHVFEDLHQKGKGLIMVMGHYTNFEWTAMNIPLLVPQKCFAVYHPLSNPSFQS